MTSAEKQAKIDALLKGVNDAMQGRQETDIPLTDPYWTIASNMKKDIAVLDTIPVKDVPVKDVE